MAEEGGDLLVMIIDLTPSVELMRKEEHVITQCIDGIMVFCNSHLMLSSRNKLAVIGCYTHKSCFLYPHQNAKTVLQSKDGQYELFSEVDNSIKENIKSLVLENTQEIVSTDSLLAGAICMALCYINRIRKEQLTNKNIPSRILVFTSSGDNASQYMNFMNAFFTAQKEGIIIDACILEKDSGLLQQGCDITGGIYLKIPNPAGFLQYLLWVFLPNDKTRKEMVLPPRIHVDYRAACFCHRTLIEIGYVCSVCLSIFCSFSPICSTCQTTFKFAGALPPLKVKKKKRIGI
ncbi:general transcription factor IIH subunit 3 [Centruroides vittatus]|uniref:general transcription factor IIH subunit 3 n=1 Tax=Centruroides vittatus TaxID=120091 RepID=UPI00350F801C